MHWKDYPEMFGLSGTSKSLHGSVCTVVYGYLHNFDFYFDCVSGYRNFIWDNIPYNQTKRKEVGKKKIRREIKMERQG